MKIEVIVVSPFQQNSRIIICEKSKQAVIIDPGDEAERFAQKIAQLEVTPSYILATHGHIDHIGAVADLQQRLQLPFYIHEADRQFVDNLPLQATFYGMSGCRQPQVTRYIEDGEIFTVGELQGKAIHTPGHSPGSISFLFGKDLFVGDVLFAGSIGRTDLPGGDFKTLRTSIITRLYCLDPDTRVHSGHGPTTTIGREMTDNAFVRA